MSENNIPKVLSEEKCYQKKRSGESCSCCFVNANKSAYSRKCFMTGEYCSKQTNIQQERHKLHDKDHITAFVIMSFSDMTNVVYKWRIKDFIEKLKKHLAFDEDRNKIYCYKEEIKDELELEPEKRNYHRVKEIHVERSDTDTASNYVICSRVCQRMQIADLIIVDVSHQNPNVFYELGMAVALGKLILPICFSESYYKMEVPELIKETDDEYKIIEHHIGSYPWRKALFEYYGIFRVRRENSFSDEKDRENQKTHYMTYDNATKVKYGFSDIQYSRFPYVEPIPAEKDKNKDSIIGKKIYNELRKSYNEATKNDNTLIVYTMDNFLNSEDAGVCIVNFYHSITARMQQEQCFSGDRVGVLVQGNGIPEEDKDSEKQIDLFYSIGEIIHIGVNQAIYLAEEKRLKTGDIAAAQKSIKTTEQIDKPDSMITIKQRDEIIHAVKGYVRNRGVIIYPNNPVYVKREKNKLEYIDLENVLQEKPVFQEDDICSCSSRKIECLYHKTLEILRYVNEIVVDISNNSIQCLFWLGAAHGSNVNAVTVLHEATEKELEKTTGFREKKIRTVFDVAGLWTAILHSNDTEGFYRQLAQAQYGIEQHSKLMMKNRKMHEKKLHDYWIGLGDEFDEKSVKDLYEEEKKERILDLESYYRSRFWNTMLRHNQLLIFMPQIERIGEGMEEPKGYTSKWDFKASALLSHYLSKRTVISEYRIKALREEKKEEGVEQVNYISLGSAVRPLEKMLPYYIFNELDVNIHEHVEVDFECGDSKRVYKGFKEVADNNRGFYRQHPQSRCGKCDKCHACVSKEMMNCFSSILELKTQECRLQGTLEHTEIAQLILWRENASNLHEKAVFRVAINGSSGPATLALSVIFVDEEQKIEIFNPKNMEEKDKYKKTLLHDLQTNIRKQFMDRYKEKLYKKLDEILDKDKYEKPYDEKQIARYRELVWYAVSSYLYTELYRYFLPLLSEKDIRSLYNGMYNFVNYMRIENESPFNIEYPDNGDNAYKSAVKRGHVILVIQQVSEILLSLLREFRGLEAFYEVRVAHNLKQKQIGVEKENKSEDNREILDIKLLDAKDNVNCFWK